MKGLYKAEGRVKVRQKSELLPPVDVKGAMVSCAQKRWPLEIAALWELWPSLEGHSQASVTWQRGLREYTLQPHSPPIFHSTASACHWPNPIRCQGHGNPLHRVHTAGGSRWDGFGVENKDIQQNRVAKQRHM